MTDLVPFRAYRYASGKIVRLEDVVTQPYDKISPEMREAYWTRHPVNIVRVIKNPDYAAAADFLNLWIRDGVLRQDTDASFYPYEQTFEYDGETCSRLGLIGLVSLEQAETTVKGHENILREPLEDRLNLIRQTESNEGLVFTLYSDPAMAVDALLMQVTRLSPPLTTVVDEYQTTHRLWRLSDPEIQQQIRQIFENRSLYIADGHHRFQTSVLYYRECLARGWKPAAVESFDKRLVALFNIDSPGLKILATHRGVRNVPDFDPIELLARLERFFEIVQVGSLSDLQSAMTGCSRCIGLRTKGSLAFYVMCLKPDALAAPDFLPGLQGPARELDVNLLHDGILRPYLGITREQLAAQNHVDYYRDPIELAREVEAGRYQVAFFLNPTTLQQVREIAHRGEKMPQKSTDFYPKLLTGLVIMKMQIDKTRGEDR